MILKLISRKKNDNEINKEMKNIDKGEIEYLSVLNSILSSLRLNTHTQYISIEHIFKLANRAVSLMNDKQNWNYKDAKWLWCYCNIFLLRFFFTLSLFISSCSSLV